LRKEKKKGEGAKTKSRVYRGGVAVEFVERHRDTGRIQSSLRIGVTRNFLSDHPYRATV
jgi:hypothetical protein